MEIDTPLTIKRLGEVVVGELLILDLNDTPHLSVCLEKREGSTDLKVGLLDGEHLEWPYIVTTRTFNQCGSYGTDWFVQLEPDEQSYPYRAAHFRDHYGTIVVASGGPLLLFGPQPRGEHNGGCVTLPNFTPASFENDGIPYKTWTIWRTKDAFDAGEEAPLRQIIGRRPALR